MKYIFNKQTVLQILETFKVTKGDVVWIHHPITNDLVKVDVIKSNSNNILVSIPKDSPYFGQPDFKIKKTLVIGIN